MNFRDWRRRAFRRDLATAVIGLGLVALALGFTQTRPFYSLVKNGLGSKVTKANINGSTDLFLKDGVLTDEESKSAPAATVRWKASRQAMGAPAAPLWEQGAVEVTGIKVNDPATTETRVREYIERSGLGPALPNFVGGREVAGKSGRVMFPTPAVETPHVDRAFATFRANWPRNFRLACGIVVGVAVVTLLFPRTLVCWRRSRRGRCVRCGYDVGTMAACPECNLQRQA